MKVKIRENLRLFEHDDTDFYLQGTDVKELQEKNLRSYSIKHYLFTGKLQVVEGDMVFQFKSSKVYVAPDILYGLEYGKFFKKDLEFDTLAWIDEDQIPKEIYEKLTSIEPVEPETVEPETVEPETVEPETVEPETVEPETVEPETVEPETVEPETVEPETVEPETVESEVNLNSMTKDELINYAENFGLDNELTPNMRVSDIRIKLKELLK